jgi:hypothetical protein
MIDLSVLFTSIAGVFASLVAWITEFFAAMF